MQLFVLPFYRHDERLLRDFSVLGFFVFFFKKYIHLHLLAEYFIILPNNLA